MSRAGSFLRLSRYELRKSDLLQKLPAFNDLSNYPASTIYLLSIPVRQVPGYPNPQNLKTVPCRHQHIYIWYQIVTLAIPLPRPGIQYFLMKIKEMAERKGRFRGGAPGPGIGSRRGHKA